MPNFIGFLGLGATPQSYESLSDIFIQSDHSFDIFEYPGFGSKAHGKYSSNPFESCLLEVSEELGDKDSLNLIGHSMGSVAAIRFAQKYPDKINSIILIEGNLIAEDCGYLSRKISTSENEEELQKIMDDVVNQMKDSPYPGWQQWATGIKKTSFQAIRDYAGVLVQESDSGNLMKTFQGLNMSKLYIYGDEYIGHPVLGVLGNTDRIHIKKAGHFVMTDQPQQTADAILNVI